MKVQKFGGTSVGTPQRIKDVCNLITEEKGNIVVFSAMSGTTNKLVEIADYFKKGNSEAGCEVINELRKKYFQHIEELYSSIDYKEKTRNFLLTIFEKLRSFSGREFGSKEEKEVIAQGEIMSTNMITNYLLESGIDVQLLSAFDFMKIGDNREPNLSYINEHLHQLLEKYQDKDIYITQGFIALNAEDEIDNLERGGSDYTACLIGSTLFAEEIQIWTDIDGMHNNDPRVVQHTEAVRRLNFEEAAELAYFGAKILHPTCIQPARFSGVPVKLKNTMDAQSEGTMIDNHMIPNRIKAVAAKDNITAIKIVSSRMLLATGFLIKVFEVFEKYKTSIDMITTSEVGVSLSIDDNTHLAPIVEELKQYGIVDVDEDMCIICIVGDLRWGNIGFEGKVAEAMSVVPVRMISYGGSNYNISFLIREQDKAQALQSLSEKLFV